MDEPPHQPPVTPPVDPGAPPSFAGAPPSFAAAPPPHAAAPGGTPSGVGSIGHASFGRRLGGTVLDGLFLGLLLIVITGALVVLFVALAPTTPEGCSISDEGCDFSDAGITLFFVLLASWLVLYLAAFVLYTVVPVGRTGQTLGRRIVGVRVVDMRSGAPCGFGRSLVRALVAGFASGAIFYLGYLWMLWDDNKQTWHDKASDTIVITT